MSALPLKRRRIEQNPEIRARLWREWEATHELCPLRTLQNNPGRLAVFVAALDSLKRPASVMSPPMSAEDVIFDLAKLDQTMYPIPAGHPVSLGPSPGYISEDTGASWNGVHSLVKLRKVKYDIFRTHRRRHHTCRALQGVQCCNKDS